MRKPAVVVTLAVSAVLAGGVMLATVAVAQENPRPPASPSTVPPPSPAVPSSAVPSSAGPVQAGRPHTRPDHSRPAKDGTPSSVARPLHDDATPAPTLTKIHSVVRERARRATRAKTRLAAERDEAASAEAAGDMQQQALDIVNASRRRIGCGELTVDRRLVLAATRHAADMARRGYFSHESAGGGQAGERVQEAGYRWARFGENIARGQGDVVEVIVGWMGSPEHRANILDCRLREVGIGLAFSADRTPYWVQDFATPQ